MHALEWIAKYGTRLRSIAGRVLRERLGRVEGECTWCQGRAPASTWCSQECYHAFLLRCDPRHIRVAVWARDEGFCDECGEQADRWESHHVVPVEEGGGLCDVSGYRTR